MKTLLTIGLMMTMAMGAAWAEDEDPYVSTQSVTAVSAGVILDPNAMIMVQRNNGVVWNFTIQKVNGVGAIVPFIDANGQTRLSMPMTATYAQLKTALESFTMADKQKAIEKGLRLVAIAKLEAMGVQ